jgi:methionyl-tRNA formyltransferase
MRHPGAVFFGSPAHAVPALAALATVADVRLVVTVPDAPRGRSRRRVATPVAEAAEAWGMPVAKPEKAAEVTATVEEIAPDVALVTAYRGLIRPALLAVPRTGFVNVHFSLLPRWRGASPVVRAVLAGDDETGVTLMQMDEGLDTGPVLGRRAVPIGDAVSAGVLTAGLAAVGAEMVTAFLPGWIDGTVTAHPQPEEGVTAAGMVTVEEAFIDPALHGAGAVLLAVRAFDPNPGAWGVVDGERVKLWRARPAASGPEPGVAALLGDDLVLGTAEGAVVLDEVQPAGKRRMSGAEWARGRRGEPARFERPTPPRPR